MRIAEEISRRRTSSTSTDRSRKISRGSSLSKKIHTIASPASPSKSFGGAEFTLRGEQELIVGARGETYNVQVVPSPKNAEKGESSTIADPPKL